MAFFKFLFVNAFCAILKFNSAYSQATLEIPLGGNAYITSKGNSSDSENIDNGGLRGWRNTDKVISIYFKLTQLETFDLALTFASNGGTSQFKVTIGLQSYNVKVDEDSGSEISVGTFVAVLPGYVKVDLQAISRTKFYLPDVNTLKLTRVFGKVYYIKRMKDFYYGRRGPSVHLEYTVPSDTEYFYNELYVEEGNDPVGEYMSVIAFDQGYAGMQVNSETERRVIFSIFSLFQTDDPSKVPEKYKIKLLKKGPGVVSKEFGNEGSGGQTYLVYPWKTGITYEFLVRAVPTKNMSTIITAWFAPKDSNFKLVASMERPTMASYLGGMYSFSENFLPDQGYIERRGLFGPQWLYRHSTKAWEEVVQAEFTSDPTAMNGRKDYACGVQGTQFYLRNIGFFNDNTELNTDFTRLPIGVAPNIKFKKLP